MGGHEKNYFFVKKTIAEVLAGSDLTKEVIGQDWSSEVVALFLEDWELGRVAFELPHGHGPSLPRNEGCVLG